MGRAQLPLPTEGGRDSLQYPTLYSLPEIWRHQSDCSIREQSHVYAYAKHITTHQLPVAYAWPKKPWKEICWLENCWPSMKQEQVYVARAFLEGKAVFAVLPTGVGKSLHVLCMPTCSTRYLEESFKSTSILLL